MTPDRRPGPAAVAARGWLAAHRWLLLRRLAQLGFLALFLSGPLAGVWIAKGTLASSLTLDLLPLTDPLFLLQSLAAGHRPEMAALIGAAIVLAFYALIGGRGYCAWVCPVNALTDAAHWLRHRLGLGSALRLDRRLRYWLLAAIVAVAAITGIVVWETVNPVTLLHRGLVFGTLFGLGLAGAIVAAVFLFDLAVSERGWCGHVCPVGAFYALIGRFRLPRVAAPGRARCDQCRDCYLVCPEPHVIAPALAAPAAARGTILGIDCTNCGRCIDVCPRDVFAFSIGGRT